MLTLDLPYKLLSFSWTIYCCFCNSFEFISLSTLTLDLVKIFNSEMLLVSSAFLISGIKTLTCSLSFSIWSVSLGISSARFKFPGAAQNTSRPGLPLSSESVSYTHLDVYKRQSLKHAGEQPRPSGLHTTLVWSIFPNSECLPGSTIYIQINGGY